MVTVLVELVIPLLISIVVSFTVGYLLDSFKKPYPVNRIDYWIRKHFRKSKINGKSLEIFEQIELEENEEGKYEAPSLMELKTLIKKIKMNGIEIKDLMEPKNDKQIIGRIKVENSEGKFTISCTTKDTYNEEEYIDQNLPANVMIKLSFDEWTYKKAERLIEDSMHFIDTFIIKMKDSYKISENGLSVTFNTRHPPLIISYLMRASKNKNTFDIDLENNLHAYFTDNKSSFVNVNSRKDIDDIMEAIVWYV